MTFLVGALTGGIWSAILSDVVRGALGGGIVDGPFVVEAEFSAQEWIEDLERCIARLNGEAA